ncbi:MAG: DUF4388 domain-containing protein [Lentisphaerae bacterium]|nr:DUF4388 domain-containing protein [Lentisphaerota bacterium]
MLDPEKLKQDLIASGKLTAERLAEVERVARDQRISLSEALISRLMISFSDLGAACARVTGLPYVPLVGLRPSDPEAPVWMSPEFAACAHVFPIAYDPQTHVLKVAVQDAEQAAGLERSLRFLMQDSRLEFSVAPDIEMQRARERGRPGGKRSAGELAAGFARGSRWGGGKSDPRTGAPSGAAPGAKSKPGASGASGAAPAPPPRKERRPGSAAPPEPGYSEMSQSLISAVTHFVRLQFSDEPERVHGIRTCVRYCQLMASRLKFAPVQVDALVLGTWLSALDSCETVLGQFSTPYRLEEVIYPDKQRGVRAVHPRVEGLVLKLVRCYQDLKAEKPEVCRNVNLTRRELYLHWSAAPEHQQMLETFLQVLVDEEFLDKLGRSAGRILIVDPEEIALCSLAPPLISMGYDVIAMPDTRSARDILDEFKPDLILVSVDSAPDRVLWFCERLKGDAKTAGVPILAMVSPDDPQLTVKCLRAGANDYLSKPVHPELLFLKVQNHLSAAGVEVKECGVSGSLEEMSFTDMIQILSAGRRNVDLFLNSESAEGRVYIREGDVVHAVVGEQTGDAAFYALMRWKSGTFTTRQCGPLPERTIHVSTMSLLMEGSRQVDEAPEAK